MRTYAESVGAYKKAVLDAKKFFKRACRNPGLEPTAVIEQYGKVLSCPLGEFAEVQRLFQDLRTMQKVLNLSPGDILTIDRQAEEILHPARLKPLQRAKESP